MNYWERHIGDYARDTGHLTMTEHGAYSILLDRYYATEQGIPADQAHRVARARTREERAAVDAVLGEFFVLADGVWTHGRVEEEIEKATARVAAARENGRRGGRPKSNPTRTQEKPIGLSLGSVSETQTKAHQTPDTSNTEAIASAAVAATQPDPDRIWGTGLAFLLRSRIPDRQARSLIGKLRQACGDVETGALLAEAEADSISDPAPWLMAAASKRRARAGPNGARPPEPSRRLAAIQTLMAGTTDGKPSLAGERDSPRLEPAGLLVSGRSAVG